MTTRSLSWDDLELLRTLAETATASAAARRLGVDQTTISRRLTRIEQKVGAALFERIDRRLVPAKALEAALGQLARMAETADVACLALRAAQSQLSGQVTISAVDPVATWVLAPRVGELAVTHPDLRVQILSENRNVLLARHEADIALRLARPREDAAITWRLGAIGFTLAGPAGGFAPHGLPLAAYEDSLAHLPEARFLATWSGGRAPAVRTNTLRGLVEAVAGGMCSVLPRFVVARDARLTDFLAEDVPVVRELWLMTPPHRRRDPAVAAVIRWIEAAIASEGLR